VEKQSVSPESIARLADKGADVSAYFTNNGKIMPPLDNVGIVLNKDMTEELNESAQQTKTSVDEL
jgi:hypothetical protein